MKRLLIVLVALFTLGLTTQASAQEIKLPKPVPAKQIIDILGQGQVKYDAEVPATVIYAGSVDPSDPRGSIDTVLKGTGFEAVDQADGIHIRQQEQTAPAVAASPASPAYLPTDLISTNGSYTAALAAQRHNSQLRAAEASAVYAQQLAATRVQEQDYSMSYAVALAAPPYGTDAFYAGGLASRGPSYGYGYYNPWMQTQQLRIRGDLTHGWLKINAIGDTDFAKYLVVLRQTADGAWVIVGSGGKAFRAVHEPMELPVGRQKLRFELRRGGTTTYLIEDFDIDSKFDREHSLQYPISEQMILSFAKTNAIVRQ